jgi:uncharacterized membrane protein YsdA (DUF1294 family)
MSKRKPPLLERPTFALSLVALLLLGEASAHSFSNVNAFHLSLVHLSALSAMTAVLFGFDKWKAGRGRRVSEANLILLSVLGGAAGGLIGMRAFRHKTRKPLFRIALATALLVQVAALLWLGSRKV